MHCSWKGCEIKKVIDFSHNLRHFIFGGFPYQVNICPSCYQSLDRCNLEKKMVTMVVMTRVLVTCSRVVARNKGVFPLISSARFTSHFLAINSWNDFQEFIKFYWRLYDICILFEHCQQLQLLCLKFWWNEKSYIKYFLVFLHDSQMNTTTACTCLNINLSINIKENKVVPT